MASTLNGFSIGDKVTFGRSQGEKTAGTIVGLGRSKLKVRQDESRGTLKAYPIGTVWTVPVNFACKVGSTPVTVTPPAVKPAPAPVGASDFARKAALLGLPADCLGKWITLAGGKLVQIVDLEPRRPAYPVSVQGTQGGRYKVPALSVQMALGRAAVPAAPTVKRDEAAIMQDILGVYCGLSPENLSCDGECSRTEMAHRAASLRRRLRELETELGRKVSEDEVWRWDSQCNPRSAWGR